MQTKTRSASSRDDIHKLSSTLTRLLMPTWLRQIGVIAGVLILWYWIAQQILQLGRHIRYDGLIALGADLVKILTDINPYLWWGVIAILSLIVLSVTRNWFLKSRKRSKSILVSVAEVQKLTTSLSSDAISVLQWVWDDRSDPITIGDLQATRHELRAGRVRKMAMSKAQAQALSHALTPSSPDPSVATPQAASTNTSNPTGGFWASHIKRTEPAINSDRPTSDKRTEPML